MWLTAWLIISSMTMARANDCPNQDKKKLMEELLVKENPTQFIQGIKFSDVWVREYLSVCECSYVEYTKKSDGYMQDITICRTETGELIDTITGKEGVKETVKHGVYSLSGAYDTIDTEYTGYLYIIYADKHAFAYYACDCKGDAWNMGVQVRSDEATKMSEQDDNEVKKSVEEARQQMLKAAKILNFDVKIEFIQYKLDKLC